MRKETRRLKYELEPRGVGLIDGFTVDRGCTHRWDFWEARGSRVPVMLTRAESREFMLMRCWEVQPVGGDGS